MAVSTTITDIAQKLKVSPGTVSRALHGHPAISVATKEKVKQMAEAMNYRVNKVATSLRSGQTGVIGVIIPSVAINFFGAVVHGIETIAYENGYQVLIYQSNESEEKERKGIEIFLQARVDGILLSVAKGTHDYNHLLSVQQAGIPLVLFDRIIKEGPFDSISIDDFEAARLATQNLIENGYSRIAHITGPLHMSICEARLNGYKAALVNAGLPVLPEYIVTGDISIESGLEGMTQLLRLPIPPDALFAVEDFTALGALQVLKQQGIRVPENFGLFGFANEGFCDYISPTLSSIDQQTLKMGAEAFMRMKTLIQRKSKHQQQHVKKVLPAQAVFRESSQRRETAIKYITNKHKRK